MTASTIGFIGLGNMGGGMAHNLVNAGHDLIVYDVVAENMAPLIDAGAIAGRSTEDVIAISDMVMTCVPSFKLAIEIIEQHVLPYVRAGQTMIEFSTMASRDAQRFATAFGAKGVAYLDMPVSGGRGGAEAGTLRMFAGGDHDVFMRCKPLFDVVGDPDRVVHCGPNGYGQFVKMVNQLTAGLSTAVCVEMAAAAVQADVKLDVLNQALGGNSGFRQTLEHIIGRVQQGTQTDIDVKFSQFADYLQDADSYGIKTPLVQALYEFMKNGDLLTVDDGRDVPALWHELVCD